MNRNLWSNVVMKIARYVSIVCIAATLGACAAAPSNEITPESVADISGKWIVTLQMPQGAVDSIMTVIQTGSVIKGTLGTPDSAMGAVDYTGNVNGKDVTFSYSVEKFGAPVGTIIDYVGVLDGAAMKGRATFGSFGGGDWSAKRP
jgi:hypothetical protein